jgi:hypothetical protein
MTEREPEVLIVPLGSFVRVRIGVVEPEQRLGFSVPSAP